MAGAKKEQAPSDKPKAPISSFFRWMNDNRAELLKKNPGMKPTEVTSLGGKHW
jgi:hypothetical protein